MRSLTASALLALLVLSACAKKPEMLVCYSVSDAGGCELIGEELATGREYTVLVRQGTLPEHGTIRLERFEAGRAVHVATAPIAERHGDEFATNPLILPRAGMYRVSLLDDERVLATVNVRAPRPSVWNARTATPADRAAP